MHQNVLLSNHKEINREENKYQEIKNLEEKINIQEFSNEYLPYRIIDPIEHILEQKKSETQLLRKQSEQITEELQKQTKLNQKELGEIQESQNKLKIIQKKIQDIDMLKLQNLKKEKEATYQELQKIDTQISYPLLQKFWDYSKKQNIL
ncbi:MAG: hypothetical protein GXP45_04135 [bacterium]|nr:hypothetical protein [bacterium]